MANRHLRAVLEEATRINNRRCFNGPVNIRVSVGLSLPMLYRIAHKSVILEILPKTLRHGGRLVVRTINLGRLAVIANLCKQVL